MSNLETSGRRQFARDRHRFPHLPPTPVWQQVAWMLLAVLVIALAIWCMPEGRVPLPAQP